MTGSWTRRVARTLNRGISGRSILGRLSNSVGPGEMFSIEDLFLEFSAELSALTDVTIISGLTADIEGVHAANTLAIQAAIDAMPATGGVLRLPSRSTFFATNIKLHGTANDKSNIVLDLNGSALKKPQHSACTTDTERKSNVIEARYGHYHAVVNGKVEGNYSRGGLKPTFTLAYITGMTFGAAGTPISVPIGLSGNSTGASTDVVYLVTANGVGKVATGAIATDTDAGGPWLTTSGVTAYDESTGTGYHNWYYNDDDFQWRNCVYMNGTSTAMLSPLLWNLKATDARYAALKPASGPLFSTNPNTGYGTLGARVLSNHVFANYSSGIGGGFMVRASIMNNYVYDALSTGIRCDEGSNECTIVGNEVDMNTTIANSYGIVTYKSHNVVIDGNRVRQGAVGIVVFGPSNKCSVTGNNVSDGTDGIALTGTNCVIQGNVISSTAARGIVLTAGTTNARIVFNAMASIGTFTVYDTAQVASNIIYGNGSTATSQLDLLNYQNLIATFTHFNGAHAAIKMTSTGGSIWFGISSAGLFAINNSDVLTSTPAFTVHPATGVTWIAGDLTLGNNLVLPGTLHVGSTEKLLVSDSEIFPQIHNNANTIAIIENNTHSDIAGDAAVYYGVRARGRANEELIVQSGDAVRADYAVGFDGVDYEPLGYTLWTVDGATDQNDMPGRWSLWTTPDGSRVPVERVRVASTGAWGLAGANYGTANQVFTSAGSAAPPTWATPSTTNITEGTNLYYTDERVDDRVAALIQNGTGITWSYSDAGGTLTPTVTITQYTDELAQDAVGGILTDSTTIDFTYTDGSNQITAAVKTDSLDTHLKTDLGKQHTNTSQAAFLARNSVTDTDVTGDGTVYTIICDTEIYDQGANYNNATGVFTAPVTGRYLFTSHIAVSGITTHTAHSAYFTASNRIAYLRYSVPDSSGGVSRIVGSAFIDMDANDTVSLTYLAGGATKVVDILGHATDMLTAFGGALIC